MHECSFLILFALDSMVLSLVLGARGLFVTYYDFPMHICPETVIMVVA